MKTILVPTDLSSLAESALQVGADLARTYGAEILLVHYLPFSIVYTGAVEQSMVVSSYLHEQETDAKADLQKIAENPAFATVSISPITCQDESELFDLMAKRQVDLIVLATHGASGWDEWLFSSNAAHIVQASPCPVLVLKQAVIPFEPMNAIAAIDVDDVLKQNWPPYPFVSGGHHLKQFVYVSTPSDNLVPEGVHAWMDELAQEKNITDYELHIRYARSVETGILNYAQERQADLIVVYTHGRTGLSHLLQGSIAEDVLNHATIPVLILRINS